MKSLLRTQATTSLSFPNDRLSLGLLRKFIDITEDLDDDRLVIVASGSISVFHLAEESYV